MFGSKHDTRISVMRVIKNTLLPLVCCLDSAAVGDTLILKNGRSLSANLVSRGNKDTVFVVAGQQHEV